MERMEGLRIVKEYEYQKIETIKNESMESYRV